MSFADEVMPLIQRDIETLHSGESGPRKQMWSRTEPLVVFGAAMGGVGWAEVEQVFDRVAGSFHGSKSCDVELIAAESSGDLGYVCAIERSEVLDADGNSKSYALRVTTVFRREEGTWRMVHTPSTSDQRLLSRASCRRCRGATQRAVVRGK